MDKRETAIKESIAIWEAICSYDKIGFESKYRAVEELYSKRIISKKWYLYFCPFCALYIDFGNKCSACPWPGEGFARCEDSGPYRLFLNRTKVLFVADQRSVKEAAQSVLSLLRSLE